MTPNHRLRNAELVSDRLDRPPAPPSLHPGFDLVHGRERAELGGRGAHELPGNTVLTSNVRGRSAGASLLNPSLCPLSDSFAGAGHSAQLPSGARERAKGSCRLEYLSLRHALVRCDVGDRLPSMATSQPLERAVPPEHGVNVDR